MVPPPLDPAQAELSVVVISVGAPSSLALAVKSLLDQDVPVEIIVVNTGGGDAAERLKPFGSPIKLVQETDRLLPGAARNAGIRIATGTFIAFLAADCQAAPGWAEQRLNLHKRGHQVVGSALLPTNGDNAFAWASHLSLFVRRLPQASRVWALPYGASFHRQIFDTYGMFPEDLRAGEDTAMVSRLPASLQPVWARSVLTFHLSPTTAGAMIVDQYRRGRRSSSAILSGRRRIIRTIFLQFSRRTRIPIQLIRRTDLRDEPHIKRAIMLMPVCAAAYAIGIAAGRGQPDLSR